jgi:hypothetical protein
MSQLHDRQNLAGHRTDSQMLEDGIHACIHYFVRSEAGPVQTNEGKPPVSPKSEVKLTTGFPGARGYIACNKQQNTVAAQMRGGVSHLCHHTPEPSAVTCPKCKATDEWRQQMAERGAADVAEQQAIAARQARITGQGD